jgi:hypothetical protein
LKRVFCFLVVTAFGTGCKTHDLTDGRYDFSLTQSIRDDCGLQSAPGIISSGVLRTTGNVVRINYDFFQIELDGSYKDSIESMSLDGSATNVQLEVNGVQCLLDVVTLHLEATTDTATQFAGSMSFSLQAERPESCICQLWVDYRATHEP